MNIEELKASQLGVMLDSSVVIQSTDLVNALIQDPADALTKLKALSQTITLEQIKIDSQGFVRITNAEFTEAVTDKLNSDVVAAGDTNYGFC